MKRKTLLFYLLTLMCLWTAGNVPAWGDTTYKLTQVSSVEAGGLYVFEQDGYVMNNTVSSSALQTTNSYKTSGLKGTESYVWTLETATGGFYMKNVSLSSKQYLTNSSSTSVSLNTKSSIWSFEFTDGIVLISNTSNSNRFLGDTSESSTLSHLYKAYATSNLSTRAHAIKVYKLEEEISFTLNATSSNDSHGTVSVEDNVITATPAEGYRVSTSSAYTVTSGEANVSSVAQVGNEFTVTATGDCTVQINFEAIPSHKVTITPPHGWHAHRKEWRG